VSRATFAAASALLFAGCAVGSGAGSVDRAALEKQLAGLYTPQDPEAEITAECEGDLDAEVDATQECRMSVGEDTADVRVVVTGVGDDKVDFAATPFLTAERVAETVRRSLEEKGFRPDRVDCRKELVGEEGATTVCTVAPAKGKGRVRATVTRVEGLLVNFDYRVVA